MLRSETHRYQEYATAICLTLGLLPWSTIHQTVRIVHRAKLAGNQVFVVGTDSNQVAAQHIALTLNRTAKVPSRPNTFVSVPVDSSLTNTTGVHARTHADATDELAELLAPGDVIIAIAGAGGSADFQRMLRVARSCQALSVVWTCGARSNVGGLADITVVIPNDHPEHLDLVCSIVAFMVADALRTLEEV
jgi:D-sedoheptulose 7-phosphate isomerase